MYANLANLLNFSVASFLFCYKQKYKNWPGYHFIRVLNIYCINFTGILLVWNVYLRSQKNKGHALIHSIRCDVHLNESSYHYCAFVHSVKIMANSTTTEPTSSVPQWLISRLLSTVLVSISERRFYHNWADIYVMCFRHGRSALLVFRSLHMDTWRHIRPGTAGKPWSWWTAMVTPVITRWPRHRDRKCHLIIRLITKHKIWTNVGLMLAQRRRQWANIKPTLVQHLLFARIR